MIIGKGLLIVIQSLSTIGSWFGGEGYAITDAEYNDAVSYIQTPLSYLQSVIDIIFWFLRFITLFGLAGFVAITTIIIFIVTYSTGNHNMIEVYINTGKNIKTFWTVLLINPLIRAYEAIVKIIRG